MKKLIYTLFFSLPMVSQAEPEFISKEFNVLDGFISSNVQEIIQDHDGRIWACTKKGVSVFNGFNFNNYHFPSNLKIEKITSVFLDNNNDIYVATDKLLIKFVKFGLPFGEGIMTFNEPGITSLAQWDNLLWATTDDGLKVFNQESGQFEFPTLTSDISNPFNLYADKDRLWIFCTHSVWWIENQNESPLKFNFNLGTEPIIFISSSKIYDDFYLSCKIGDNNKIIIIDNNKNNRIFNSADSFQQILNHPTLGYLKVIENSLFRVADDFSTNNQIIEKISSIFIDKTGCIWFGRNEYLNIIKRPEIQLINLPGTADLNRIRKFEQYYFLTDESDNYNTIILDSNFEKTSFSIPPITELFQTQSHGNLLISNQNESFKIDRNFNLENFHIPAGIIVQIVENTHNHNHNLFCVTKNNIFVMNNENWVKVFSSETAIVKLVFLRNQIIIANEYSILFLDTHFNPVKSITFNNNSIDDFHILNNKLISLAENSIYNYDLKSNDLHKIDLLIDSQYPLQSMGIFKNTLWISAYDKLIRMKNLHYDLYELGSKKLIGQDLIIENGVITGLLNNQILRIDYKKTPQVDFELSAYIFTEDGLEINKDMKFKFNENNFILNVFISDHRYLKSNRIRYFFSDNHMDNKISYSSNIKIDDLSSGNYQFKVYPVIRNKINQKPFSSSKITILNPWWTSVVMISLYYLIGLLILIFTIYKTIIYFQQKNKNLTGHDHIYLNVFGEFTAYCINPIGLSRKLKSTFQREILFYLVMKGYSFKNGVKAEEFDTYFWPDLPFEQANNRRNVAFSRIRKNIGSKAQRVILIKEMTCSIDWNDPFLTVDIINYSEYAKMGKKFKKANNPKLMTKYYQKAIDIYSDGLTIEFMESWLDRLNEALRNETRNMCIDVINNYHNQRQFNQILGICDRMLEWDKCDIEAAEIRYNSMIVLGQQYEADQFINGFKDTFEIEIGEKPKLTNINSI